MRTADSCSSFPDAQGLRERQMELAVRIDPQLRRLDRAIAELERSPPMPAAAARAALEPYRKVTTQFERFAARRRSMMRIIARRMKATALLACRSKSLAKRRQLLIQAKVRSTIQRLGSTTKRWRSERLTISSFHVPLVAMVAASWRLDIRHRHRCVR